MPEVSLILPAYREGLNLAFLLPGLRAEMEATGLSFEVLVVDTPSPLDDSPSIAKSHGAVYLPRAGGDRYGDAYRSGISASKGQYILFMDADGSHPPAFIPKLLERRFDHDLVMASRYVAGGGSQNSPLLIWMSRMLNTIFGFVLGIPCRDLSNSLKLYRGDQLRSLDLRCVNFDIIPEILLKLRRANPGLRILEIPFTFEQRVHGESKRNLAWFILTYFWTLLRLRFSRT